MKDHNVASPNRSGELWAFPRARPRAHATNGSYNILSFTNIMVSWSSVSWRTENVVLSLMSYMCVDVCSLFDYMQVIWVELATIAEHGLWV